jgi:hypothetical protein
MKSSEQKEPADQKKRQAFITGVTENFSVIAPAGVGKTQAIVERIVHISRHPRASEWLPKLVVVTFTNKAADEMQQRAREEILRVRVSIEILEAFNRAFFGTIHSFCVKLLRDYGHHLGLPAQFDLVEDDEDLWRDFMQESLELIAVPTAHQQKFARHAPLQNVLALGRRLSPMVKWKSDIEACRELDFTQLRNIVPRGGGTKNIERGKSLAKKWEQALRENDGFLPVPKFEFGGKDFQKVWSETFAPLRKWLNDCALVVAAETARAYRAYRVARGCLSYADQITLSL